ncbi:hypothetical protein AUJ68_07015 [Candidatus Woesearchaeota archaeon CG1_02_57_44]|nr:MAG: hypothetical protein AUJ68_07015 [Candidatus Woesearchaeota archaeon CG1_02_57_44]
MQPAGVLSHASGATSRFTYAQASRETHSQQPLEQRLFELPGCWATTDGDYRVTFIARDPQEGSMRAVEHVLLAPIMEISVMAGRLCVKHPQNVYTIVGYDAEADRITEKYRVHTPPHRGY